MPASPPHAARAAVKPEVVRLAAADRQEVVNVAMIRGELDPDAEIERVAGHHAQHRAIAEHPRLAEHAPGRDAAERRKLVAQEFGEAGAGHHARPQISA